jgi:hypothetical protein
MGRNPCKAVGKANKLRTGLICPALFIKKLAPDSLGILWKSDTFTARQGINLVSVIISTPSPRTGEHPEFKDCLSQCSSKLLWVETMPEG